MGWAMLKNRNVVRVIRMIVGCTAIIVSSYTYAGTTTHVIPLEFKCGSNPVGAPWYVFNGTPGVQYTLTTKGIREIGKDYIMEINDINGIGKTSYGLCVYVEARCIPLDDETDISLTGNSLACNVGEGIKIKMFEPNSVNPDKYHYVGTLTITRHKEKIQEITTDNTTTVSDSEKEQLQSNANTKSPALKISSEY